MKKLIFFFSFFLLAIPASIKAGLPIGSAFQLVGTSSTTDRHTNITLSGTTDEIDVSTSGSTITLGLSDSVGVYVSSSTSWINTPATGTFGDMVAVNLTAGDWELSYHVSMYNNGSTSTVFQAFIGTTSGDTSSGYADGDNSFNFSPHFGAASNEQASMDISGYRVSTPSPLTIYGKFSATFSAGQPQMSGRLSARRIR